MDSLLNNPVVQSAAVPFLISLAVAFILRPHGWYWAGLGAVAGFAATVYLVVGFEFFPLRADRKILLATGAAVVAGVVFDLLPWRRLLPPLLFVAGAGCVVWLLWPRLSGFDDWQMILMALGCALYAGWLVAAAAGLKDKPLQADAMLLALGLGTGISALLGATALYGQLGSAIAAAVGARLLLHLFGRPVSAGALMVVPLTLALALLGVGAMVYSKLPWYTLPLLALVPLLARMPLPRAPVIVQLLLVVVVTVAPAAGAIYLTWRETGAPPL